jgi:hypothetical protein
MPTNEAGQHCPDPIVALTPRGPGHQFVVYGDSCSGVPGGPHEQTLASVNAIIRRLTPQPEFIIFPGDEIVGLTADPQELRRQWRYWLEREMGWIDRQSIPVCHTTGNHTVYNKIGEVIFCEALNPP